MIDHVSIGVRDLAASSAFYAKVLAPLGYSCLVTEPARAGFGTRYPELWLNARPDMAAVPDDTGCHVCLRARTLEAIDAFHGIAVAEGGRDDGPPAVRKATMVSYYAAFVRDPDGNRLEAMTVPDVTNIGEKRGS
ncbi:MAG: VOC family protein [Hyphomicrobiaceae bacterium]